MNLSKHYNGFNLEIFAANIIFFVVMSLLLPIMFEDNDDTTMVWIANGIYSGTPDCHLVFTNALWGCFLNLLYNICSEIEWYVVCFAAGQIISFSILVDYILKNIHARKIAITTLLLVYSLWALIIVRLQFTTTASIIALSACVLLLDRRFLFGGGLLIIASMIRFDAAGLVGLIMVPSFLYQYRTDFKNSYLPLSIILLFVLVIKLSDKLFYQTDEWKYYTALNIPRGQINDNPNLWRIYQNFPNDVDSLNFNLVAAFAMDPKTITPEELQIVSKQLKSTSIIKERRNVINGCIKPYFISHLIVAVIFMLLCVICPDKNLRTLLTIAFVVWMFVQMYISLNATLKFRVFLSALMPMIWYILYGLSHVKVGQQFRLLGSLLLFAIISLTTYSFIIKIVNQSIMIRSSKPIISEQMSLFSQRDSFSIVPAGACLSVELLPPFNLHKIIDKHSFINPYCMAGSPLTPNYQSYKDYVDKNLLFFTTVDDNPKQIIDALNYNYNVLTDTIHYKKSDNYVLVRFVTKCY